MLKILKNLKQSWISVLAIVLLLCLQAAVDLELPNYTSKIVNEGIQSGGIEDAVPNEISMEDMEAILLVTEDDNQILSKYSTENGKYIKASGRAEAVGRICEYGRTVSDGS